jgi:hypothetical protein
LLHEPPIGRLRVTSFEVMRGLPTIQVEIHVDTCGDADKRRNTPGDMGDSYDSISREPKVRLDAPLGVTVT